MKVFKCTDFEGHYPVGVAALIVADTKREARIFLAAELDTQGLGVQTEFTLVEIPTDVVSVHILNDGNY